MAVDNYILTYIKSIKYHVCAFSHPHTHTTHHTHKLAQLIPKNIYTNEYRHVKWIVSRVYTCIFTNTLIAKRHINKHHKKKIEN